MVIDHIQNTTLYSGLSPEIRSALDYLSKTDFEGMEPGRYDIDGDKVFALVQKYDPVPREKGMWEAHRRYIDLQYVAEGGEVMGYAPLDSLAVTQPYSEDSDCALLEGSGNFFEAPAGTFALFYPQDAHMPCLAGEIPQPVTKVVVKIAVDQG